MSEDRAATDGTQAEAPSAGDGVERRVDAAWVELTAPGAQFEVVTVDVRGQMLRTFASAPRSLTEIWASTSAFADRNYIVFGEERITYGEAQATVASVAEWLARHGVGAGDRVAIAMRNYPEWLLAHWATLCLGAVVVGVNAWWIAEELAFALDDATPKVVLCDAERRDRLTGWAERNPHAVIVVVRADAHAGMATWAEAAGGRGSASVHEVDPDDDACIFYTSGTTGTPKGARLTHRGCVNTLACVAFATELARLSATEGDPSAAEPTAPVALVTTPLFHVTANNCLAQPVTAAGGTVVLMYKWDAGEALRLIEAEGVTVLSGVPTMVRELLGHADFRRRDLSSLATLNGGGAQLPPDLVTRIAGAGAGVQPSTGFGMTETCGIVTAISGAAYLARQTSCGRPLPTFEVSIVNDGGAALPTGSIGEVLVRGAGVIKGYWNRPKETDATIVDGWLCTGDVGRLDEGGYLHLVDRKKDMVLRGGENVYCAEVEAALYRHPAVAEACVFGVPDERLGEEVGAAIVFHPGIAETEDDLRRHAAGLIAAFKVPRHVWIMDAPLPRNATGKFMRRELRAALSARVAGA